jgi:hypothetical protein
MQVDGRLHVSQQQGDVVIHNLTANIGQFEGIVTALLIYFFEEHWRVMNITSARGTLHCRKTRIPCGDPLVFCGY